MNEQEYLDDMFVKLAFISFRRHLGGDDVANLVGLDKLAAEGYWDKIKGMLSGAAEEGKTIARNIGEEIRYGGPKKEVMIGNTGLYRDPGIFAKGQGKWKYMRRAAAPGAALGALIGGGLAARRGGDAGDVAKSTAIGGAIGGIGSSLLPAAFGGAARSPLRATAGRAAMRAGGLLMGGSMLYSALRPRAKGEGFFESIGRRSGDIAGEAAFYATPGGAFARAGQGLMMADVGGEVGGAIIGGKAGKLLSSIPTAGEVGGTIGKGLDILATGTRKMLGGGKSYSKAKAEALGPPLRQPKPQGLEGQQYIRKAEYQ